MNGPREIEGAPVEGIGSLIDAFRDFNSATASLNLAYRRLEDRIEQLTQQLEEKDRELYSRLRELDRVTRYLNSLLESISSGVIAVDMEGRVTLFNRTAAELTGIDSESAIGKSYREIAGDKPSGRGALDTLRDGPELRGVEKRLPGSGVQILAGTTWVVDSLGDRIGVVEVFDDISTVKRLEEKVEHQKTLSALGEMASAVAHELRNPLSGIGGFAALLRKDLEGDPSRLKLVDKILQGVHALDKVATNLLFLTRRTELKSGEVDLKVMLDDLVQLLQSEASSKGLDVEITSQLPDENVTVSADSELLRMIFTNLGRNALIAVDKSGEVSFKLNWKLLGNRFDVEVADNGCGIAPENLPRLFNPFFTTRTDGTGLGLALVKKAVDLHKGEIMVDSAIGKGARFEVSLPIRNA